MSEPEFSRMVRAHPQPPERLSLSADEHERSALAERFGVVGIKALAADLQLEPNGVAILANGRLAAEVTQVCSVSDEEFTTRIEETVALRFVPAGTIQPTEEEIELASDDPDEIEYEGDSFDLGEALAQSLGLAIDPYAEGPGAEAVRREAGLSDENTPRGPLAEALAKLTKS
jgi:uncharacterized metal-binding protein YceD (DUF177 family)